MNEITYTRFKITIIGLYLVFFVLFGIRLYIQWELSPLGFDLGEIQDKLHAVKNENMVLKEKILSYESFTNISKKSRDMGFIENKNDEIFIK